MNGYNFRLLGLFLFLFFKKELRYRRYYDIAQHDLQKRSHYFQASPYLEAIQNSKLAFKILRVRCQISILPAHDPLLARDPRRALHIFGPKPAHQHIDYALRYCRLCTPHPSTWGPYTLPGLDAHIGNEEHLLLYCTTLQQTTLNLQHDMQELLTDFRHKYKGYSMPQSWSNISPDIRLCLALGSMPPPTWRLSMLKAKKWIYASRNAIASCLLDVLSTCTEKQKSLTAQYSA